MKINVYVNCEEDCIYPENQGLIPIQIGAAISENILPMEQDNTGENISDKYNRYKSLTSQYWVLNNIDSDYIGFMQANNYFNFNAEIDKKSGGGV